MGHAQLQAAAAAGWAGWDLEAETPMVLSSLFLKICSFKCLFSWLSECYFQIALTWHCACLVFFFQGICTSRRCPSSAWSLQRLFPKLPQYLGWTAGVFSNAWLLGWCNHQRRPRCGFLHENAVTLWANFPTSVKKSQMAAPGKQAEIGSCGPVVQSRQSRQSQLLTFECLIGEMWLARKDLTQHT